MTAPIGVGIFLRELSTMEPAAVAAKKAAAAGIRHVALLAVWQEHGASIVRNRNRLAIYAEAFKAQGIKVRLWAYPWHGLEREFCAGLRLHIGNCAGLISGVIVNPELGYRHGQSGPADVLMHGVVDVLSEGQDLWVSSYGHPEGIRDFPWHVFGNYGHQSGQFYLDGNEEAIRRGLAAWLGNTKSPADQFQIPGIPVYGEQSEAALPRWLEWLKCAYADAVGRPIPGVIAWSWPQVSPREWLLLSKLAAELDAAWPTSD
jgi:hypothetical protein